MTSRGALLSLLTVLATSLTVLYLRRLSRDARKTAIGSKGLSTSPPEKPNGAMKEVTPVEAADVVTEATANAKCERDVTVTANADAPVLQPARPSATPQPEVAMSTTPADAQATAPSPAARAPASGPTGGAAVLARLRQQKAASAAQAAKRKAEEAAKRSVTFLYASQTGTAEEIAKAMHDEAVSKGFKSSVNAMDECGLENITPDKTPVLVIVAASTGDGDAPDNSVKTFTHLKRAAAADNLKGIVFTVMGLGDSNYSRFMEVPRTIKRRLLEQGAAEFYASAEADEVDGIEDIVDAWRDGMWSALTDAVAPEDKENQPENASAPSAVALSPDFTLKGNLLEAGTVVQGVPAVRMRRVELKIVPASSAANVKLTSDEPSKEQLAFRDPEGRYSPQQPFWAPLRECRYLTAKECEKRVIHLALDVSEAGMRFEPGDAMSLDPVNASSLVDGVLERLQVSGDMVLLSAKYTDGSDGEALPHLRLPCTLRHALARACDLTAVPTKSLLAALAQHCRDPRERLTLQYLASRDGREAYKLDVAEGRPTLLQLLRRFPSCAPPVDALLEALPPLRPRLYSLTNSPLAAPDSLECAFRVVEFETHYGLHHGVATTWLQELGDRFRSQADADAAPLRLPVHLRPSTGFRPPADSSCPIIMVGPGTGVAPFRGFLQQRRAQRAAGTTLGESWLFFGNWKREWDFLYEEELQSFVADGTLTHLHLAWSRETSKKVYVQDKMRAVGESLCEALLEQDASLYVCGDGAAMAKDVHAAVKSIIMKHGDMDGQEADDFLKDLTSRRKYLKDIWL